LVYVETFYYPIYAFLTDLARGASVTTGTCTREAVDKVVARATILAGVGRTLVDICQKINIMYVGNLT